MTDETVLVTGASGTLGGALLPRLDGHRVRAMSRRARPGPQWVVADLSTGDGVEQAVRGVGAIVHLASQPRGGGRADLADTRRLLAAAARAQVRHVLYVSIVGIDRVPVAYYRAKLAAEGAVRDAGVPWSVLRATQFPQLLDGLLSAVSRFGVLPVDRAVPVQPVHPGDVAGRIVDLLAEGPTGDVVEYGGPRVLRLDEVAGQWRRARGMTRPMLPVRVPGRLGAQLRAGALTTTARPAGERTWGDYLAETYRVRR